MKQSPHKPMSKEHPLDPPLPFDMKPRIERATQDVQLLQFVDQATYRKHEGRVEAFREAFGDRYDEVRALAGQIKQYTLDHLDTYLEQFIDQAEQAGTIVHYAKDADEANEIAVEIARENECRLCVKSKSMVTEETRLVPALESAGLECLETDLGEFIVQLDDDAPSHIVTPMIHKDRRTVARAFVRELDAPYTEEPEELTAIARQYMREKYRRADLGISGANFLIAETGSVVLCTNEGNADLAVGVPNVHIVLAGIEKVIPQLDHLSVFLKVLARSSTAQPLTVYTTFLTGARRTDEHDGPEQVHLILLDNGRSKLLTNDTRELLRCIRCGACLNACPVFRTIGGGHAYGAVYSGPIGSVLTPGLKSLHNYPDLPQVSTLCSACYDACPVQINIPHYLIRWRRESVDASIVKRSDRFAYRFWAGLLNHSVTYRLMNTTQRLMLRWLADESTSDTDSYSDCKWIGQGKLPGKLSGWTDQRDLPSPTSKSFRRWWSEREGEK